MSQRPAVLDKRRYLTVADRDDMLAVLYLLPYWPAGLTARKIARAVWPGQTRGRLARVRRVMVKLWDSWRLLIEVARLAKTGSGNGHEREYWIKEGLSRSRAKRLLAGWPEAQQPNISKTKGVGR